MVILSLNTLKSRATEEPAHCIPRPDGREASHLALIYNIQTGFISDSIASSSAVVVTKENTLTRSELTEFKRLKSLHKYTNFNSAPYYAAGLRVLRGR